jgi:hypothetical protein
MFGGGVEGGDGKTGHDELSFGLLEPGLVSAEENQCLFSIIGTIW